MLRKSLPALQRVAARLRLGSLMTLDGSDAGGLAVRDEAGNLAPVRAAAGQGPDQIATKGQLDAASASGIGDVIDASAARAAGTPLTLPPTSGVVGVLLGGPAADRPAPGVFGRFWLDDAGVLSADDGSAWVVVSATTLGVGSQIGVGDAQRDPASGDLALDLATGNLFDWRVDGSINISLANPPSGAWTRATLLLTNGGSAAVRHPPGAAWPGGIPPRLSALALDFSTASQEVAIPLDNADTGPNSRPVAASGDLMVVGDNRDTTAGVAPDGRPAGAARWYRRDAATGTWALEHEIFGDSATGAVLDVQSVAADGARVVISARADPDDSSAGHILIFERDGGAWLEVNTILSRSKSIAAAVGIEGDRLVIGDTRSNGGGGKNQGVVRIHEFDGAGWPVAAAFAGDAAQDQLGRAVAISGDRVAATAPRHQAPVGQLQIYRLTGLIWGVEAKLLNPEPNEYDTFGDSLDLDGATAVVGDPRGIGATGTRREGRAVVFADGGEGWAVRQFLRGTGRLGQAGTSVAVQRGVIAVGAPNTDLDGGAVNRAGVVRVYRADGAGTWALEHTFEGVGGDFLGQDVALAANTLAAHARGIPDARIWRAGGDATDRVDRVEYLRSPDGSIVQATATLDIR